MQFSQKHLYQSVPSGTHLLSQWEKENGHLQAYLISHLYVVMGKHPFLFTYSMHNNQMSFLTLQSSS